MEQVIYMATAETLERAVIQIPHPPSRPIIEPFAEFFIKSNGIWEVSSGWWYPRAPVAVPYPSQESTFMTPHRAINLNRFVTNGVSTRSGEYQAIQGFGLSSGIFAKRYLSVPSTAGVRDILRQAISNAVRLRADQVFHDGNHRTALLILYEILAEHKLLLQAKPVTLYILLSNRSNFSEQGELDWKFVETRLYQHCRSRLKVLNSVPSGDERISLFANAVKTLETTNSVFNQLAEMWFANEARHLAPARREVGRHLKGLNRGVYQQFYRLCVLGSWEGPPKNQMPEMSVEMVEMHAPLLLAFSEYNNAAAHPR